MINRNNYEAYLLDLLEGHLSSEEQKALRDFLQMNPDCSAGVESLEPWILEKGEVPFPGRENLKKELPGPETELTAHNFDLYSIARMEGDLTREQTGAHEALVAGDKEKRKEWEAWQQTKLVPDSVAFPLKSKLKKRKEASRRFIWISIAASAAAVTLLVLLFRTPPTLSETGVADVVEETVSGNATGAGNEISPKSEPSLESEPSLQREVAVVVESMSSVSGEPVTFPIKNNSGGDVVEGMETDNLQQVDYGVLLSEPVRIAVNLSLLPSITEAVTYDRIVPLEVPPASIHLSSISISQLREIELQSLFDDFTQENNISLWTIANAGIQGINRVAGTEMSLMASRDEEGEVSGFRFTSRRFTFARPLNQR